MFLLCAFFIMACGLRLLAVFLVFLLVNECVFDEGFLEIVFWTSQSEFMAG